MAVLVFTDGVPNCDADPTATGIPTLDEPERAAQWLSQGIRTYVVGLPGAEGVRLLDDISERGGTDEFINPTDPAQLQEKLRGLVEDQVSRFANSCTIDLDPAPPHPGQVRAFVRREDREDEVAREQSWTIRPDGRSLELLGMLCSDAMRGAIDALRLEYGCALGPE